MVPSVTSDAGHRMHGRRGAVSRAVALSAIFLSAAAMRRRLGRLPEWPKGAVCKTVGSAYVGSNPTPATLFPQVRAGVIGWWHRLLRAGASGSRAVCGPAVGQTGSRVIVLKVAFELAKRVPVGLSQWPAVGVNCGPSAGRAGRLRTYGGRRQQTYGRRVCGRRAVGVAAGFPGVAGSV